MKNLVGFFSDQGIKVSIAENGGLNLKGLSGLTDEIRNEVLTFARENKASILSELAGFLKVQEGPRLGFSLKMGGSDSPSGQTPVRNYRQSFLPKTGQSWIPSRKLGTCPTCGENRWWRKNEPRSKLICGRCHPPAPGLDIFWEAGLLKS